MTKQEKGQTLAWDEKQRRRVNWRLNWLKEIFTSGINLEFITRHFLNTNAGCG